MTWENSGALGGIRTPNLLIRRYLSSVQPCPDRSVGAAARALGTGTAPAFVFPEMSNPELVRDGWYPSFVDYLHHSFSTAMAFSPTDVSAIKPWAKLMMMAEETISVVVGILVVARAVNILK